VIREKSLNTEFVSIQSFSPNGILRMRGMPMSEQEARYAAAGVCVVAFLAAQTFQHLAYWLWIPAIKHPQDELRSYLLRVDRVRALLVGGTILLLLVPYVVVSLRYFETAPVASVLGLIFGAGFVACEIAHRGVEFVLVGTNWARRYVRAAEAEREPILRRYAVWNELTQAWYFPLLLAHLLASCSFLAATWTDLGKGVWHALAPAAFALNSLRLVGRMTGMFAEMSWLNALNNRLYFPSVLVINTLLATWFFYLARQ
jgi:hypothetical protein